MIFCYKNSSHYSHTLYATIYCQALATKSLPEKLKNVPTNKGGGVVQPVQKYCGQGEGGQLFVILCWRLLWTPGRPLGLSNKYLMCNFIFRFEQYYGLKYIQVTC